MIVVSRQGKTTAVTGWRAWLAGAAILLVAVALLSVIAFFALGLVLTIATVALILLPVAIGVGLIGSLFRPPPRS